MPNWSPLLSAQNQAEQQNGNKKEREREGNGHVKGGRNGHFGRLETVIHTLSYLIIFFSTPLALHVKSMWKLQPTNRFFSPNAQCGIIPLMHSTVLFLSLFRRACDLGGFFFRKTQCDVHIFFELFLLVIRLPSSPAADKLIHPQNDLDQFLGPEKLGRMIPFFFFPCGDQRRKTEGNKVSSKNIRRLFK